MTFIEMDRAAEGGLHEDILEGRPRNGEETSMITPGGFQPVIRRIIIIRHNADNRSGCATTIAGSNSAISRSAACMHGMSCLSCFLCYPAFSRQLQPRLPPMTPSSEPRYSPIRRQHSGIMGPTAIILVFLIEFTFAIRHGADTSLWHTYARLVY